MKKICPILTDSQWRYCKEIECAWWDKDNKQCIKVTQANALINIADRLDRLDEHMNKVTSIYGNAIAIGNL